MFVLCAGDVTVSDGPQAWCEVLASVPKCQEAVMRFTEKMHVLDNFVQAQVHY